MSALLHQPAVLLFTFVLIILFPLADAFVYARLQTPLHVYLWNIVSLWTLTLIAVALLYREGFTLSQFGQNFGVYPRNILTVFGVVILVVAVTKACGSLRSTTLRGYERGKSNWRLIWRAPGAGTHSCCLKARYTRGTRSAMFL
jgi:hypothetical protein